MVLDTKQRKALVLSGGSIKLLQGIADKVSPVKRGAFPRKAPPGPGRQATWYHLDTDWLTDQAIIKDIWITILNAMEEEKPETAVFYLQIKLWRRDG